MLMTTMWVLGILHSQSWPNNWSFWMEKTDGKWLTCQLDLRWCVSFFFQGFEVFFFSSPGVGSERYFLTVVMATKFLRPNKYSARNSVLVVNFQWSMKENVFMWPNVFFFGQGRWCRSPGIKMSVSLVLFASLQELKHCKGLQDVLSKRNIEMSWSIKGDQESLGLEPNVVSCSCRFNK